MFRYTVQFFLLILLTFSSAGAQSEKDVKGGQDHPLLSRMPGFYLSGYEVKDFDSYETAYVSGPEARWEGKVITLEYYIKTGAKPVSMTQIARNYESAIRQIGGNLLREMR